jgi:ribosomal protein L7Ae-like RNA K-turn-binding protein
MNALNTSSLNYKEIILCQSVKTAIKDFISNLINDNQVPVYMVKNLLLEAVYNLNIKEQAEYEEAVKEYRKQQQAQVQQETEEDGEE